MGVLTTTAVIGFKNEGLGCDQTSCHMGVAGFDFLFRRKDATDKVIDKRCIETHANN